MGRASVHAVAVVVGALSLFTSAEARATKVAILPAAAERITVEQMDALRQLDGVVRDVATGAPGLVVLSEAQTKKQLASVKDMGITCEVDDAACLSKIAVLVEVDRIVAPVVRFETERTTLRIVLVDAAGARAEATRAVPGVPTLADVRSVLNEAFAATPISPSPSDASNASNASNAAAVTNPTLATNSTTATNPSDAPPAAATSTSTSASVSPSTSTSTSTVPATSATPSPSTTFVTGAAIAAVGAVLAVGCGAGAYAVHEALAERESFDARIGKMIGGQALLYASLAGVAGVGVGVALIVLE